MLRIQFEINGPIAYATVNRPEARNAMTTEMYDAFLDACERVDRDPSVRVFIVRGGREAFISGTDIAEFTSFQSREDGIRYERHLDQVVDRFERVTCPTIAQVEGVAAGGGCLIALAADLRVCTPRARFGVPIARTLGNCLSAANTARLIDLIGPARTKELLMTGRLLDATEAAAYGLVTRLVDSDGAGVVDSVNSVDTAVDELARAIAANAPLTIRATKEMVRRIQAHRRLDGRDADDLIAMCYTSDDFREGVAAFLAKRPPRFTGR